MSLAVHRPRLVVAIHDVAPTTLPDVRWLLSALDGLGVRPRVLLAIPDEAGAGDLRAAPELVDLLRSEADAGSEIVQHGCLHRVTGNLRGPVLSRARARLFAARDAEFLSLDRAGTIERLVRGRTILGDIGLEVQGFCAPAWLADGGLGPVLGQLGYRYDLGMYRVTDLTRGRRRWLPAIGYLGAGGVQERLVGLGGLASMAALRLTRAGQVFLHPQGASGSRDCARVLHTLERLQGERGLVTYRELLDG